MRRAAVPLMVLLGGCAVGPDYHRPQVAVPDAYRSDAALPAGDSVGDALWTEIYPDSRLRALIGTALRNNHDLQSAMARIDEARAALGQTRLGYLPTINAAGTVARSKTSTVVRQPGAPRIRDTEEARLAVSYELDLWGRVRRSNEAAKATLLASEYARRTVATSLVADVANAYYTLLSLDVQLDITRRTIAAREKYVELTRAQHERGYATGLDAATAQAQAAAARSNAPELERRIARAENGLCVLLGENPHRIERDAQGDTLPEAAPLPPPGLPSALLERRPDVRAAEEGLRAANANIGVAKAALFPSISLTGYAGSLSSPLGNLFRASTAEWSAAAGLLQPLLDAQRSRYQLDLATARKREALVGYEKTVQTAFREVADALVDYAKYGEYATEQTRQVTALRKAEEIALARYRVGYAAYFDVISADRDLYAAELALSEAHANSLTALVRLYQALGGGWQDAPKA